MTKLLNQETLFEFAYPWKRNLNKLRSLIISKKIQAKDNHINFLVQEVRSKRIEEQLEVKKTQDVIQ